MKYAIWFELKQLDNSFSFSKSEIVNIALPALLAIDSSETRTRSKCLKKRSYSHGLPKITLP